MNDSLKNNNDLELNVWRDITDPRRAEVVDDLEAGLKAPDFENIEIPEHLGIVKEIMDDHKIKRYAFMHDDYNPWAMKSSPFDGDRIGHAGIFANDLLALFTLVYRGSDVVGLHTEEQLWFDSPAKLNEIVTLEGKYVDSYIRRGQGYVVMDAKVTGSDGRSIVRRRGIEIMKTTPGSVAGRASATPDKKVTGEIPENPNYIEKITADVKVGDVLSPMKKTITAEQAAVFSRVGEYLTNIHNNLNAARGAGLRVPIVQGLQIIGTALELLTRAYGADFFTEGWIRAKCIATVKAFEPFEISGIVTDIEEVSDNKLKVYLDFWARRQDGRLAIVGWSSCTISK